MGVRAAVMTGPGAGAIATIELSGESVRRVLEKVFRPSGGTTAFDVGQILLGHVVDGAEAIDQVTLGCEATQRFTLHCHGNPLIVERIMEVLRDHGASLVQAEQLRAETLGAESPADTMALEAQLALTKVKTLAGARIIASQRSGGLSAAARRWRDAGATISLDTVRAQATRILTDSDIARLIISGCTIALVGPPNTGKSTLLNALAGRDKAVVADVEGTTRDWISAEIHIPPLAAEVIDTAGFVASDDGVDQAAQVRSAELLRQADVVLLVLDASRPLESPGEDVLEALSRRKVITVLNKSDLPTRLETEHSPDVCHSFVRVSARLGEGLEGLIDAIHCICGVTAFDEKTPICFTARQRRVLEQLQRVASASEATSLTNELLEGPLSV